MDLTLEEFVYEIRLALSRASKKQLTNMLEVFLAHEAQEKHESSKRDYLNMIRAELRHRRHNL